MMHCSNDTIVTIITYELQAISSTKWKEISKNILLSWNEKRKRKTTIRHKKADTNVKFSPKTISAHFQHFLYMLGSVGFALTNENLLKI